MPNHQLTTRARAEAYRAKSYSGQAQLATFMHDVPEPPPPPAQGLSARQRLWLLRFIGALAIGILGAALWPDGQTRPLSYSQPEPVQVAGSQGFQL